MADPILDMNYALGGLVQPKHPPMPDQKHPSGHFSAGGIFHSPEGHPIGKQDGPVLRPIHQPQGMMSGGLAGVNPMQGLVSGGMAVDPAVVGKGNYANGGPVTGTGIDNTMDSAFHTGDGYAAGGMANPNFSGYASGGLVPKKNGFVNKDIPYKKGGFVNAPDTVMASSDNGSPLQTASQTYANGGPVQTLTAPRGYASGGQVDSAVSPSPGGSFQGLLAEIPGYGQGTGDFMGSTSPNQKNGWAGTVGNVIGSLLGTIFSYGNPMGGAIGGMAGKQAGNEFGNIIAGRDAFNGGKGDFWDNLNPLSANGAASVGQALNNAQAGAQMPQNLLSRLGGGLGGGLPGMGGGMPGIPGLAEGGVPPSADEMPEGQQAAQGSDQAQQNQQIAEQAVPPEGKADNIPAKLSKGEFVMDAATVMYWGVGKLKQMQEKAHTAIAEHMKQQAQNQQQQAPAQPQGHGLGAPPMPAQLPPQAAAQPTATQQRIAQTATPPKAPSPSPSPFSLAG